MRAFSLCLRLNRAPHEFSVGSRALYGTHRIVQAELTRVVMTGFFRFRSKAKPWVLRERARTGLSRRRRSNTHWGVDVDAALNASGLSPSRCTAGRATTSADSRTGQAIGGGLAVTGNYPGKARTAGRTPQPTSTGPCPSCPAPTA